MSLVKFGPVGTLFLFLLLALPAVATSQDSDLSELLQQVGPEYAEAYISPFIHAHGANQNAALYHTADWGGTGLNVSIGLKFMATHLNADDQTFRKVINDVPLAPFLPEDHPNVDDVGHVVLEGPTVFGDTEKLGKGTFYVDGIPVAEVEGIPGLVETRWVPLFAPQLTVGRFYGLSGTLRWFPEINISDYGKTKFLGWGLTWGVNTVAPTLPVDIAVGYFHQNLDVGTILKTEASSLFAAVSKSTTMVTVYGGLAKESSKMDVAYTFQGIDEIPDSTTEVAFSVDGRQDWRFTLGATLMVLGGLNVEISHGDLTTYSAGLLVGFSSP
jgi:hypothetical protein